MAIHLEIYLLDRKYIYGHKIYVYVMYPKIILGIVKGKNWFALFFGVISKYLI